MWYVIRCSSGQEKKAYKHIDAEFKKQNLYESVKRMIIPTRKEVYVKNGKKVNREVNYFPGYILIETEMGPEIQHIIKETTGVISILGSKDKPEPIRPEEVRRILGKIDDLNDEEASAKLDFVVGENIVISEGPFANFNAVIEEINAEKKKLKVGIKIFGRRTPMDIDFSQVIKN
jgi:transcriptional antiterminator NusG